MAHIAAVISQIDAGRLTDTSQPSVEITPPDPSVGLLGPTAAELRAKAQAYILAARTLGAVGSWDVAADIIGYAAEFALKARYLAREGWANWPASPEEAARRGVPEQLMTHDLERLLRLSGNTAIARSGMHNIDWARACEWRVGHRYRALGAVTPEQVASQIEETDRLCRELALHTAASRLRDAEVDMASTLGPFNFFAVTTPDSDRRIWDVMYASWWDVPTPESRGAGDEVWRRCLAALADDDLRALFRGAVAIHPGHAIALGYYTMFSMIGYVEHALFQSIDNMVGGFGRLPTAIVITCVPRRPPSADKAGTAT